jgi:hypothetical protein
MTSALLCRRRAATSTFGLTAQSISRNSREPRGSRSHDSRDSAILSLLTNEATMNNQLIALKQAASTNMMGMRHSALPLRLSIEEALQRGESITIDFTEVEATQSFVDELLGVLVSRHGPGILSHMTLKGCSPALMGVVKFVVADRVRDFKSRAH